MKNLVLQLVLVVCLGMTAGYLIPAFENTNWDIILFLTPAGILRNLRSASPVMRSFYSDLSPGSLSSQFQWQSVQGLGVVILIIALVALGFRALGQMRPRP